MPDLTINTYKAIEKNFKYLSDFVEKNIQKKNNIFIFPESQFQVIENELNIQKTVNLYDKNNRLITIKRIEYRGEENEFNNIIANELFYSLANHFTPDSTLLEVYKKNSDVDGFEGCRCDNAFFLKIGDAMRYAQSLIKKYFRNKNLSVNFPEIEYYTPTRVFDDGSYANSIIIEKKLLK